MNNTIHHGDAIDLLKSLPDQSVDFVLTDPPYNTTRLHFDKIKIDYETFFAECWRVLKDKDRAVVMTAAGKLEYTLKYQFDGRGYRYDWIWEKSRSTNFPNANVRPLSTHEHVLVFGQMPTISGAHKKTLRYFPQKTKGEAYHTKRLLDNRSIHIGNIGPQSTINEGDRYPTSVLHFPNSNYQSPHPSAKPLALWRYLIRTYTLPDEIVVDPFAGGGTTALACLEEGRHYIVGDMHLSYVELMKTRVAEHQISRGIIPEIAAPDRPIQLALIA